MTFTRHPVALLLFVVGFSLCRAGPAISASPMTAGAEAVEPAMFDPQPQPPGRPVEPQAPVTAEFFPEQALAEQALLHLLFRDKAALQPPALEGQWVALNEDRLLQVRGGFITDSGLEISFGIERAVYVNGDLVAATSLNVMNLGNATLETLRPNDGSSSNNANQGGATVPVNLVQIGPGNTITPGALANGGLGTVIQNSLNDQAIRSITTIEATVNSLQVLRGLDLLSQIQASIIDSLPK